MSKREGIRKLGLKWRITVAFVGGALAVSALLATATYVLAERYLLRQRVDDVVDQSMSSMATILRELQRASTDLSAEELTFDVIAPAAETLRGRESFEAVLLGPGVEEPALTDRQFFDTVSVPGDLRSAVERGQVGYVRAEDRLVFGSPVPGYQLQAYLFFPLGDVSQTLTVLRNVLIALSLGAVGLAALAGTRVSSRVVDPVRRASRAARKVAEGLLETRLPTGGGDEVGGLADSFNEMAAALEGRIARERRFVSDVSHELRTPLTTLRTSTDYLLQHREDLSQPVLRAAELLAADLGYLQRLVDDLLDLSRVDAGRIDMGWERLNLADLTREVVARRTRAEADTVSVELESDPKDLSTVADKRRLERVVGNLVDNALVHGRGQDVTVRLAAEDGHLLLSVEDHGPGVPVEAGRRIFERFFKADPARHRDEGRGSGLGLAIARENAHLHGGEILVYNSRERGARFTLRIPRRDQEPEE